MRLTGRSLIGPLGPRSESLRGGLRLFFGGASGPKLRLREPGAPPPSVGRGEYPPGRGLLNPEGAPPGRGLLKPPGRGPGGTIFPRPRFAHREGPPLERLLVEAPDRLFGDLAIGVVDEREASRPSGFPIGGKHDLRWCSDARQMLA